jgi:hypothetical protein
MGEAAMRAREDEIKWWDAMDLIGGVPLIGAKRDPIAGLELARQSGHPDAVWLSSVMAGVANAAEFDAVLAKNLDRAAACLLMGVRSSDKDLVLRAALAGLPAAQASMWTFAATSQEKGAWVQQAAAGGDRAGMFLLAEELFVGTTGPRDKTRAMALYREAAALGHAAALCRLGLFGYEEGDPERYRLWEQAGQRGDRVAVAQLGRSARVQLMWHGLGRPGRVVMAIGQVCGLHAAPDLDQMFGVSVISGEMRSVRACIRLFERWSGRARQAIECWIWIARQRGVVRDIRRLIARRLWDDRHLWEDKVV